MWAREREVYFTVMEQIYTKTGQVFKDADY